jgi:hypothetical protein
VNAQRIVDYFAQHVKIISVQPVSSKKSSTFARNKCRYSVCHGCAESDSSHCGNCGRDKRSACIEEDGEVWRNEDYYFMYPIAQLACRRWRQVGPRSKERKPPDEKKKNIRGAIHNIAREIPSLSFLVVVQVYSFNCVSAAIFIP